MTEYQKLIDEIKSHPAVDGVWKDSETLAFGVSLRWGYGYFGDQHITADSPECILKALEQVEQPVNRI